MAATAHDDPPPSYESVIGKISADIKVDTTPQDLQSLIAGVTKQEANVIAANEDAHPSMTPEEEEKFRAGYLAAINSTVAKNHLAFTADAAAKACKTIDDDFDALASKLGTIDATEGTKDEDKFLPSFLVIRKGFKDTLQYSKDVATDIAGYGERFDQVIVPICLDKNIEDTKKLTKLDEFIEDAKEFKSSAETILSKFDKLNTDLIAFTSKFSGWSLTKEQTLSAEAKAIETDIGNLRKEIEELKTQQLISGGVAAAALPLSGTFAICLGPFAPVAIVAGLVAAGVATGFAIAYTVKINDRQDQKQKKEAQKKSLDDKNNAIKAARLELTTLGDKTKDDFGDSIKVLGVVWTYAANDAVAIKKWLTGGKKDIDMPKYVMMTSIGNATGIYTQMAVYLRRYADGIDKSVLKE